jgi:hypothetical protein
MWKIVLGFGLLVGVLSANQVGAALTLSSSFNVTQTYTDNLFFNDNNKKSDFGTAFGPNFGLQYDNPDIVIGGIYSGRFIALVENFDESRYVQNANIILDLPFLDKQYKGLTVTIDESMNFTPQLDAFAFTGAQNALTPANNQDLRQQAGQGTGGSQQGTGGSQGVFTRRTNSFFNNAGLTLTYAWLPSISPSLNYTNQYRTFSSNNLQDSLTHSVTLTLPYQVSTRTTVFASHTYRQTNYIGSNSNGSADKFLSHSPQVGISYSFTPLVTGSISAGASANKTKGGTQSAGSTTGQNNLSDKWQTNAIGSASINKTYQKGSIGLNFNSTIGGGGGVTSQASRSRVLTGNINHQLSQRMNAFGSIGYAQNKSTTGNSLDVDTIIIQTGLGYVFTPWLSGNLNYSHIDQNSKSSVGRDVQVNQVFLGLTAIADPWVLMR